jgi:hypothetical protein
LVINKYLIFFKPSHISFMDSRLVDLINNAQRWSEHGRDYLPTLGCSACGKGCMPLCGLGVNRKVSPMESKDVVLKSRKTMLETGKLVRPVDIQIVSCTGIIIMYERALDSIQEREIPGKGKRNIFIQPIPTMGGLLCKECKKCQLCGQETLEDGDRVKCNGLWIRACAMCVEPCAVCGQGRLKHHNCCDNKATAKFFDQE